MAQEEASVEEALTMEEAEEEAMEEEVVDGVGEETVVETPEQNGLHLPTENRLNTIHPTVSQIKYTTCSREKTETC